MSVTLWAMVRAATAAHAKAYSPKGEYRAAKLEEAALERADREGFIGYTLQGLARLPAPAFKL